MRNRLIGLVLVIPICMLLAGALLYNLPPIKNRLSPTVDDLRTRIKYALSPPDEAVFIPQGPVGDETLAATPTLFPISTPTTFSEAAPPTENATALPEPTAIPTITPTPIPQAVILDGVRYVDQHNRWNYCGPANLAMALNFWGWPGTRDDIARVVKPGIQDPSLDFIQQGRWDKNVMPYEMANFVADETGLNVVVRHGGNIDLIKGLIAAGFPVVAEKGYYEEDYTGKVAWLGHYLFTTGYDEGTGEFIVQDAWLEPGNNLRVDYQTYIEGWRSFNYLFMVVYPPDRETEVLALLGDWADPTLANQHALETANRETQELTAIDEFFAWFNKGTSHVQLLQYGEAAAAYDTAFSLYAQLGEDDTQRPYRIMWYQTGPYWGYYYTGRYQDVINLANTTLYDTISEPTLEESLYWRGLALEAMGDLDGAYADLQEAVHLNPNFEAGLFQLNRMLNGG
jgi:tetratricopeptide (TPR) repeat protein